MSEWRVNMIPLMFSGDSFVTIRTVFPQVDKMTIAKRLREWGIDVGSQRVFSDYRPGVTGWTDQRGNLHINMLAIPLDYPTDETKYLFLSHELSHFLHMVEDRTDERVFTRKMLTPHSWWTMTHEQDAVRWMARQAKVMGMSEAELDALLPGAISPVLAPQMQQVTHAVFTQQHPEERGVRPMFRRPVSVRSYQRRRK